jgi:cysteine desulfurase
MKKITNVKTVYLDYAAATPVDDRVFAAAREFLNEDFANPSSIHSPGVAAAGALESARKKVADFLSALPREIIFTSGGTESDNLAILGGARAAAKELLSKGVKKRPHIVTSKIEHHAVLETCGYLANNGFDVSYVGVLPDGTLDLAELKKSLRAETVLVSVMHANNEIGVAQPINEIIKIIRRHRKNQKTEYPYLHTDACQSANYLPLNVNQIGVDFMSLSGAKVYAPKGVGVLYVRGGVEIDPTTFGGKQEGGRRAGTENVFGAVAMAEALTITSKMREREYLRLEKLKNYFWMALRKVIPTEIEMAMNGTLEKCLPNILNVSFGNISGESMVIELDAAGIAVSSGSACTSGDPGASHVLLVLAEAKGKKVQEGVRFSFGRGTTKKDLDYVLSVLPEIVQRQKKAIDVSI